MLDCLDHPPSPLSPSPPSLLPPSFLSLCTFHGRITRKQKNIYITQMKAQSSVTFHKASTLVCPRPAQDPDMASTLKCHRDPPSQSPHQGQPLSCLLTREITLPFKTLTEYARGRLSPAPARVLGRVLETRHGEAWR